MVKKAKDKKVKINEDPVMSRARKNDPNFSLARVENECIAEALNWTPSKLCDPYRSNFHAKSLQSVLTAILERGVTTKTEMKAIPQIKYSMLLNKKNGTQTVKNCLDCAAKLSQTIMKRQPASCLLLGEDDGEVKFMFNRYTGDDNYRKQIKEIQAGFREVKKEEKIKALLERTMEINKATGRTNQIMDELAAKALKESSISKNFSKAQNDERNANTALLIVNNINSGVLPSDFSQVTNVARYIKKKNKHMEIPEHTGKRIRMPATSSSSKR